MECGRSSLMQSMSTAPSACSYRQQVGRVSWADVTEKQDITSTSTADQSLKPILVSALLDVSSPAMAKNFYGTSEKTKPKQNTQKNHQGSKAAHSCTWLKKNSKQTKDKVQPPHVIRWEKDHTHGNSNNLNPGEGKDDAVQHFSTASYEVSDGCIGWCQRPNATPGIWTKSAHWDKQSRNKWRIKSTNPWYTTCQLWASHFCHCIHISCTYSCLLLAFREDFSLNKLCREPRKCMVAGGSTSQSSKRRKKAAAVMRNWMRPLRKGDRLFKSHL